VLVGVASTFTTGGINYFCGYETGSTDDIIVSPMTTPTMLGYGLYDYLDMLKKLVALGYLTNDELRF
jgi:hypothetical protein